MDVCRAAGRRRPAGSRAAGRRGRDRRPGRHLGAQLLRVDARAVRDGQDRRDPREHQPQLPVARAAVRPEPGRHPLPLRCRAVQDEQLRRDGRGGPVRVPGARAVDLLRHRGVAGHPRPGRARQRERASRHTGGTEEHRPDQHPVHLGDHGIPQGRDAQPPQHPQQRLLRRRALRLHRGRPRLHPGALLPLLRHGHGQPRVHDPRSVHGHPGARVRPRRDPAATQDEKVTSLYGVPTMFIAEWNLPDFAAYDLSTVRTGIMAGSPCPAELMKKLIASGIEEMTICYGMTETSPVSTQNRTDDTFEQKVGTVGRVGPHLEIKIADPVTGETLPRGKAGEFMTKGYSVMLGYWEQPDKTAEAIEDGWMHTGDIGVMHDDGYVEITGRIKDMVIRGGENVYPREIEEFLYTHPDILDAQVIGVPDEKYGEELCAWVRMKEGATPLTAESLREFCTGQLAHYKIPRYVEIVDEFPMTVTGKIRKVEMRETTAKKLGLG